MMRKIIFIFGAAAAIWIALSILGYSVTKAHAGQKCPKAMQAVNACDAYMKAVDAPLYKPGKGKVIRDDVSCLEIRQKVPSVLLVYEGQYVYNVDKVAVNIITRFRRMDDWTRLSDGTFGKVLCVPKGWMRSVSDFTICGERGHYYFNRTETAQFKRQKGRLTSDDIARMWKGG